MDDASPAPDVSVDDPMMLFTDVENDPIELLSVEEMLVMELVVELADGASVPVGVDDVKLVWVDGRGVVVSAVSSGAKEIV